MKIALCYGWQINSLHPQPKGKDRNFLGDEMTGNSLRSYLLNNHGVEYCELSCSEWGMGLPDDIDIDIAIDMNPHTRDRERGKFKILYYQNGPGEGSDHLFNKMHDFYDGIIFAAKKMWDLHGDYISRSGHKSIFLPLAADTRLFYPVEYDPEYDFEVAYCGNDIKRHRTMPYLGVANEFKLGLFGRWSEEHAKVFGDISRGQVTFDQLRKIYSSSKIMLNIHFQDCIDYGLWAGRIYDVLACNGFLISDEPYGIPEEFREYVVFSEGNDDLRQKIKYYLENEEKRKEISIKGRSFIKAKHSWETRTRELYKYLEEFK